MWLSSMNTEKRSEILFYLTLLITIVHAGFIFWDFITSIPLFAKLIGIAENKIFASGYMSTLYLALLGAYAGHKEIKRWTTTQPTLTYEENKFGRGELIVSGWIIFCAISISFWQMNIIPRLPNELFRTTLQVVGIIFGTYTSKGIYSRVKGKRVKSITIEDQEGKSAENMIMEYVKEHGKIDNKSCQKLLGINDDQAYYILSKLVREGKLLQDGKGRNACYKSV
jgi:hypothetical protein